MITAKRVSKMTLHKARDTQPTRPTRWQACAAAWFLALAASAAQGQSPAPSDAERRCGPVATPGHYGPFDYRTHRPNLAIVEKHHFTAGVEAGVASVTGDMMLDIGYTLKSSPNHHRALLTLVNLGAKTKSLQPGALEYSIECWFDRAIRFRADDTIVRMIYAQYLGQLGRVADAKQQLAVAANAADDNPLTYHNIGLILFELGDFDSALAQAHRARKLGFERSSLERLLKQRDKWREPTE